MLSGPTLSVLAMIALSKRSPCRCRGLGDHPAISHCGRCAAFPVVLYSRSIKNFPSSGVARQLMAGSSASAPTSRTAPTASCRSWPCKGTRNRKAAVPYNRAVPPSRPACIASAISCANLNCSRAPVRRRATPAAASRLACEIFRERFGFRPYAGTFCASRGVGAFAEIPAMANGQSFAQRWAYKRRLTGHGMLRRRALALIVIGLAFVALGGANLDLFDATVGLIGVAAGGAWRLCLS